MPNAPVSEIAQAVRASAPRLPATRLVLIDGPAGSGKTTLAHRLAVALGAEPDGGASLPAADAPVSVLHADDMYEGWDGLATLDSVLLGQVLEPLAQGTVGEFRVWDWELGARGGVITVAPTAVLIIEGVGVASARARAHAAVTVWVEAPQATRLSRGVARDGAHMRDRWIEWQASEAPVLERHGARAVADFLIDGTE